jgi:hypothetical protein
LPDIRPHSRPIGEMVHWSALARWEETKAARRSQRYQPRNLLAALQSVQEDKTPVVGLDGEPTSLLGLYKATAAQDKATGAQPPPAQVPPPRPSANGAGEAAQARSAGR